ncbi:flagellar hook-associated protein FlgK, partial [Bacillus cereus]|nr:flagellar hook-associated protein FlgK [Bacillus cereus]
NYMNSTLSRVESMVGTTGKNSLSSLMDGLFNAFREVAKNPEQPNYYDTLIAETGKFTSQVNRLAKNLDTVEAQTTEDIEAHVNEFNRLAASLAEANKKIGQAGTQVPNQLLDERDRIITEMSKYATIEVSYESVNPNIASIRMNGVLTVNGQDTYPLRLNKEKEPMSAEIYGSEIPLSSGAIQSAIDTKAKIADYKKNLEELMSFVKNKVNTVMGKEFFVRDQAKDMKLNPEFVKDVSKMKISAETANNLAAITDDDYKEGLSYKKALDQFIVRVASDKNAVSGYQKIHGDLLEGIQQEKMSVE